MSSPALYSLRQDLSLTPELADLGRRPGLESRDPLVSSSLLWDDGNMPPHACVFM